MPLVPPVITHCFRAPLALLLYASVPCFIKGVHLAGRVRFHSADGCSPTWSGFLHCVCFLGKCRYGNSAQVIPLAKTLSSLQTIPRTWLDQRRALLQAIFCRCGH